MGRPRFTEREREEVFDRSEGLCHHCRAPISMTSFDVDHYPVAWRDISDQCYVPCCGSVVDGKDISNLVAACQRCNRSHMFERPRRMWCGHTQLRVRRTWVFFVCCVACAAACGFLVGFFLNTN